MNLLNVVDSELGTHIEELDNLCERYSDFCRPQQEILQLAGAAVSCLRTKSVFVYGAGNSGEHLLSVLADHRLQPLGFFDKKAGRLKQVCGLPVHDPDDLNKVVREDSVLVVAVNGIQMAAEITRHLRSLEPGVPVLNGRHLVRILSYPGCFKMHREAERFDILTCIRCGVDVQKCPLFTAFLQRESKYGAGDAVGSRAFDWCGYILGQTCTLKCECCCESIPYLKNGCFVDAHEAVADIRTLADACEYLERLEFVGGEPFLHPQLGQIVEACLSMSKVGYIYIFTNGTVRPGASLCAILSNPRVAVHISNYVNQWSGRQLRRLESVRSTFAQHGVKHFLVNNTEWLDISGFEENGLPSPVLAKAFSHCFINYCHRLYKGILYRCPHQYAGIQLGRLNLAPGQYVDIRKLSPRELPWALERFERLKVLESCRHCSMPVGPRRVPAGKQVCS